MFEACGRTRPKNLQAAKIPKGVFCTYFHTGVDKDLKLILLTFSMISHNTGDDKYGPSKCACTGPPKF